jgi:hypothetical protein
MENRVVTGFKVDELVERPYLILIEYLLAIVKKN